MVKESRPLGGSKAERLLLRDRGRREGFQRSRKREETAKRVYPRNGGVAEGGKKITKAKRTLRSVSLPTRMKRKARTKGGRGIGCPRTHPIQSPSLIKLTGDGIQAKYLINAFEIVTDAHSLDREEK